MGLIISFLRVINIIQQAPEGSEGPIDDIPGYIFKPVNHFLFIHLGPVRVKSYGLPLV